MASFLRLWRSLRRAWVILEPVWPIAVVDLAVLLTMLIPQSGEVLAVAANPASGQPLQIWLTYLGAATMSWTGWYLARVLLYIDYPAETGPRVPPAAGDERWPDDALRRHGARVLGLVPWLALGVGFSKAGEWLHSVVAFGLGVAFVAFVRLRRRWIERQQAASPPSAGREGAGRVAELPRGSRFAIAAVAGANAAVFLTLFFAPIVGARALGAAGILLMAFAGWMLVGALLSHVGYLTCYPRGLPRLLPFLALAAVTVLAGLAWPDNHPIRGVDDGQPAASAPAEPIDAHFRRWLVSRAAPGGEVPVILVAAEGGGIRAAYWTASVLGRLSEEVPGFACHVYGVSGVSGGSVGAAVWLAGLREALGEEERGCGGFPQATGLVGPVGLVETAKRVLAADLLAPVLGALLTRELVAHYLPVPLWEDRAAVFERGLEDAWDDRAAGAGAAGGSVTLAAGFGSLWGSDRVRVDLPVLFANGSSQETGGPATLAPVDWEPLRVRGDGAAPSLGAYPLRRRLPGAIPLSTAAHLSARFPLVSPAGTIRCPDAPDEGDASCRHRPGDVWDRISDGGYFETSGGYIALAIKRRLERVCDEPDTPSCRFVHLSITNDPNHGALLEQECERGEAWACPGGRSGQLRVVLNPIDTFLKTRGAFRDLAEKKFLEEACAVPVAIRLGRRESGADPALGWLLHEESRGHMDEAARALSLTPVANALAATQRDRAANACSGRSR